MELLLKRVLALFFSSFLVFSTIADNKIIEIVNRIQKRNPTDCRIVSYHTTSDQYRISCIGKNLNKILYRIPITVDPYSSFLIDEDHYMDINDGMDSIFLAGHFLGRATKVNPLSNQKDSFPKILQVPHHPTLTLRLLNNERVPELGPFIRVVVDHIKYSEDEEGRYSTRIIDCKNDAYFNISRGRSVDEMEKKYKPPGNIQPITKKSVLNSLKLSVCGENDFIEISEEYILK